MTTAKVHNGVSDVADLTARRKHRRTNDVQQEGSVNDNLATSHLKIAGRLERKAQGRFRFVAKRGWYFYDRTVWKLDANETEIQHLLMELLEEMWPEAYRDDELEDDIRQCHKSSGISGVLKVASRLRGFRALPEDFDANPFLVNTPSGTLDLQAHKKLEHDPDHLLTQITTGSPRKYPNDAVWTRFIERVIPDADVRDFLQRAIGSALTGEHREDVLFLLKGTHMNGKTRFDRAISHALGGYSSVAPREMLMETRFTHSSDNIVVFRKRYVSIDETERGGRIDEAKMKGLTGGSLLTGRDLYEKRMSWAPSHTTFLYTNYGPKISGDDKASWRRIFVVPFTVTIPDHEADEGLIAKLESDSDAVMRWIFEGYINYERVGLGSVPAAVRDATQRYHDENDELLQFRRDLCCESAELKERDSDLYQAYRSWCAAESVMDPLTKKRFYSYLESLGYAKESGGQRRRRGIALHNDWLRRVGAFK